MQLALTVLAVWVMTGIGPAESTPAASQPTATAPSQMPSSGNPQIDAILDRLEAEGDKVRNIRCKLIYNVHNFIGDEEYTKTGELRYIKGDPRPDLMVSFDKLVQEGTVSRGKEWFKLEDRWFVEAKEKQRLVVRHELYREGEKAEPFLIGEGGFPLPFGQKRADVVSNFEVKLAPPQPKDPPDTDHLICKPLPNSHLKNQYERLEFFVSKKLDLPVRIVLLEQKGDSQITADFENLEVNIGLDRSALQLPPEVRDWPVEFEYLPEPQPGQ